jgi:lipoprotein-anchoring transpeptidase ErfK/SrfK
MEGANQSKKRQSLNLAAFRSPRFEFILVSLIIMIIIGFVVTVPIAYSKKILPKITVAGINLGGKDLAQAKSILAFESENFDKMHVHLKYLDRIFSPTLSQLGVAVDIDKTIEKAFKQGRDGNFFIKFKNHLSPFIQEQEVLYAIKTNDQKFNGYFRKLAKYVKKPPINAGLKINNGEIIFIPGKEGLGLDPENTKTEIIESLTRGEIKTYTLKAKIDQPYIQEPETENARKIAEDWLQAKIKINVHYNPKADQTRPDQSFTASSTDIGQWITFKEGGFELEASLSASTISQWLSNINSQATIPAINNRINIVNGKEEMLSKGKKGQTLNIQGLVEKIVASVKSGEETFEIKTKILPPENEIIGGVLPGRFKGKYIEVVLSQQKMYIFIGKKLINIFLISSGRMGMNTPAGRYKILWKTTWAKCKDSDEYYSCFMPYSMFFTNEGHAIHELPIIDGWREGSWHLGVPVSHGCIRLGIGPAAWMYNWTPIGTPVIIHN